MRRKLVTGLSGLICLLFIVLTGCQAIGGLDLNKVMLNNMNVISYEGTETISLELLNDGSAAPFDSNQMDLSVLNKVTIQLTSLKQQDHNHLSAEGQFGYASGKIPFQLSVNQGEITIQIEGASKPVVIKSASTMNGFSSSLPSDPANFVKNPNDLLQPIASYLVDKMPNPNKISVDTVNDKINNESMSLQKIHAEIPGKELAKLIPTVLNNILADEKGLKELIQQLYKALFPADPNAANVNATANSPFSDIDISSFATDYIFTLVKTQLQKLVDHPETLVNTPEAIKLFNNDNSYLKADLYVDSSLTPRKSSIEIVVGNSEKDPKGFSGLKIAISSEMWNLNKPVIAQQIDTAKNALVVDQDTKPAHFIKTLDARSQMYTLLVNELHVLRKEIKMVMKDNMAADDQLPMPYINSKTNKTMVPVRFVSTQLDADVAWNGETKEVTITDIMSGKKIVLTLGSTSATVDGAKQELEAAAELNGNTTYVPVRFIAEVFGTEVGWDNATSTVSIFKK